MSKEGSSPELPIADLKIDDSWVIAQRQAYLSWINGFLQPRHVHLSSLFDLCDGVLFILFLEQLTDSEFKPKYERKPALRIHRLANIQVIMRYLYAFHDVRLVQLSPENIVDQDEKMLLGLLYCIYEKFQFRPLEAQGRRVDDALLAWVREIVAPYHLEISSYSLSFIDGRVFLALVDAYVADKATLDYAKVVTPESQPLEIARRAFKEAEKHMGILQPVEPSQLVAGKVQDRTMVLVVSSFYHVFKGAESQREQQAKLREIEAELLKKTRLIEEADNELQRKSLELQSKAQEIQKAARDLEKMTKEVGSQKSKILPIEAWIEYCREPQGMLSIVTIPLSLVENGKKKFTLYHVKVVLGTKIWVVQRRYSQFDRLHKELQKLYGKKVVTAKPPPKKSVGNLKPQFVAARRIQLEAYLNELSQEELFLKSTPFTNFITKNHLADFIDVEAFKKQEIDKADDDGFLSDDDDDWVSDGFY